MQIRYYIQATQIRYVIFKLRTARLKRLATFHGHFFTFLMGRLIKGSWLLRKAWKIYQKTYVQLFEMFTERYGNSDEPLPREFSFVCKALIQLNGCLILNMTGEGDTASA